MKKIIQLLVISSVLGCNHEKYTPNEIIIDTAIYQPKFDITKLDTILKKSDILEITVKKTIESETSLKKENKILKIENIKLKDSVLYMINELKLMEIKVKEPKKRNLIQKIFNIVPDSIEVIKIDTLQIDTIN